ncbi:hypothetical protein Aperf_G00000106020 [Anoplocephala perfoliata]
MIGELLVLLTLSSTYGFRVDHLKEQSSLEGLSVKADPFEHVEGDSGAIQSMVEVPSPYDSPDAIPNMDLQGYITEKTQDNFDFPSTTSIPGLVEDITNMDLPNYVTDKTPVSFDSSDTVGIPVEFDERIIKGLQSHVSTNNIQDNFDSFATTTIPELVGDITNKNLPNFITDRTQDSFESTSTSERVDEITTANHQSYVTSKSQSNNLRWIDDLYIPGFSQEEMDDIRLRIFIDMAEERLSQISDTPISSDAN